MAETAQKKEERDNLRDVIVYLAFKVPGLSEAKLNKLIFLADLYHYAKSGKRLTKVPFKHFHHGPWSPEIAEEAFSGDGEYLRVETVLTKRYGHVQVIKPKVDLAEVDLTDEEMATLAEVVREWGKKDLPEIIKHSKRTLVFMGTPYKNIIRFESFPPDPSLRDVLSIKQERAIHRFVEKHKDLVGRSLKAMGLASD